MTIRERLETLQQLLARTANSPAGPAREANRLPLGRCACHEPTVKWCGRHGRPLKLRMA